MAQFLERLRQKSDIEKKTFALMASGVIVAMIFISWLSVQSLDTSVETVKDVAADEVAAIEAPLSVMQNTLLMAGTVLNAFRGVEE